MKKIEHNFSCYAQNFESLCFWESPEYRSDLFLLQQGIGLQPWTSIFQFRRTKAEYALTIYFGS